jgi:lipoate-protein ligase A
MSGIGKGEKKVAGGKLVRCTATFEQGRISAVRFSGDFFMHPEEKIEELEVRLTGQPADAAHLTDLLENLCADAALIGVSPADFAAVVLQAYRNLAPGR